MKYIRTADGRIMKHPHPDKEVFTSRYEIVKSADNIEELCDEFIETMGHTGEYFHYHYPSNVNFKRLIEDMREQDFMIYGAIWTDKGLIYVAKMNSKGELELI